MPREAARRNGSVLLIPATEMRMKTPRMTETARGVNRARRHEDQAVAILRLISCGVGCGSACDASCDLPCGGPFHGGDWPYDLLVVSIRGTNEVCRFPTSPSGSGKLQSYSDPSRRSRGGSSPSAGFFRRSTLSSGVNHAAFCSRAGPTVHLPSSWSSIRLSWKSRR
jgi:hypothetical protein